MTNTADFLDELAKKDPKAAERLRKAEAEARGGVPSALANVWADRIELRLDQPGLVDGLIETEGVGVVYGESGSGKTFVAIDLACHVAAGRPWRDMEVEQGVVVYVAAENPTSVKRRIWAWKQRHGVDHLPVLVVTASVDLLNGSTDKLVELVDRVAKEHGRVALVVIDTLARAMTGNENAPEDMGKFVAACGRVREACQGFVLIVHHSGKDQARGARGHSCLRAATDVELEVTSGEGGRYLTVKKNRDGEEGAAYGFRLETVELGTNAKGRVVTTCVTVEADPPERKAGQAGQARPSQCGRVALQALQAAVRHAAERPPDHPETRSADGGAVRVATWRHYFRQTSGYEDDEKGREAERKAWNRGRENARAVGAAKIWGDWAWPL